MRYAVAIAVLLLAGCFEANLDWSGTGGGLYVCVEGDAGRCCVLQHDLCTVLDQGCAVGGPAPRPRERCQKCWPYELEADARPFAPPPNPPPAQSGATLLPDGGVDDPRIEVCGPAEYQVM